MRVSKYILLLILFSGAVASFVLFSSQKEIPKPAPVSQFPLKILAPQIPEQLSFAGEKVPLDEFGILEKFDNELISNVYFHSNTIKMLKRSAKWFPIITPILKENNIPEDFKYLALTESGLQNVTSPSGAKGFWQFLKKTARQYGLEVNKDIDERYHVALETQAACDYLNDAYQKFGSWTLAAASYNAGMDKIAERLASQKANSYYDLYLNTETARYVFRILAIKTIFENPEQYGFFLTEKDFYPPYKTRSIVVDTTIDDLVDFAKQNDISYRILKAANPWLRSDKLPDQSGKKYIIEIPVRK